MPKLPPARSIALPPATSLRDVTRNCDEDAPLASGDPRWQDLSPARGDDATIALRKELEWRKPEQFVHAAFVSHRGAGKSTEILRMTEQLAPRYETVYLEATVEMDPFSIDAEDLLVNLAMAVEARMRALGKPLPDERLQAILKWFDGIVRTTSWANNFNVEAAAGVEGKLDVPFVGSLFGSLKGLFRRESEYRTEVKQVLKKYPGTLLQSVNELLGAASHLLGDRGLLVVLDNLDRYDPEVIDRLLVAGADRIRELRCNLILTPPISLLLRPRSAQLDTLYSCHHLYAVRLRGPDQRYDELDGPGGDLLRAALARRIDLAAIIPDRVAQDRLISASGGAIRELLDLVSQSALLARGETIEEADVERALSRRRQRIRDLVNASGWIDTLARLSRDKQIFEDEKCLAVLFHRLAFKYNGDGWYDVHPLVSELPEFQRALRSGG